MKKISYLIILFIILTSLISCNNKKDQLVEIDEYKVIAEYNLPLPHGATFPNITKIIEITNKAYLLAYFYPLSNIYIYDLETKALVKQISLNIKAANISFVNKDSIWVMGYPYNGFNNDSSLMVIDYNGRIKHVYPLYHPNLISSKYPDSTLIPENKEMYPSTWNQELIIQDNKVFFSFDYSYYGFKGYKKRFPIVGYYDLVKDTLITNHEVWFPYLKEGGYYKSNMYNPVISLNNNGNILICFSYTPTFYEWNYHTNKIKTHKLATHFIDSIIASNILYDNNDSYNCLNFEFGTYGELLNYQLEQNLNFRTILLPEKKYGKSKYLTIFSDNNYCYKGESYTPFKNIIRGRYKDKYIQANIENGYVSLKLIKPIFKQFNKKNIQHCLDSLYYKNTEALKKEVCRITGNITNKNYQPEYIVNYARKAQNIKDTSFALAILNNSGCGPCNDYVLKFVSMNQSVMFTRHKKPFYLMYVKEGSTIADIKTYLNSYNISDYKYVKFDTSRVYKEFHPFSFDNPRLILVSKNKVVADTISLPSNLDSFVEKLMNFYGLERE